MKDVTIDDVIPLLPKELKNIVEATNKHKGFAHEHTLSAALAVINFAAQRHYDVDTVRFGPAPLSEFFIILQERSGGKSSLWKDFLGAIEQKSKDDAVRYSQLMEVWEYEMAQYNRAKSAKSREACDVIPSKPQQPPHYDPFVENPTYNGIISHLESTPFAGVFTQEGAMTLNGHDSKSDSSSTTLTTGFAKLWSGEALKKNTSLEKPRIYDRRCNMLLMIQKSLADKLFSKKNKEQGLFSRFLIADHKIWIRKLEQEADDTRAEYQTALKAFHKRLNSILNKKVVTGGFDNKQLILKLIVFSESANVLRREYSDMVTMENNESLTRSPEKSDELLGKLYEHACRLAGTIAVFNGRETIEDDDWLAGLMLAQYYITNLKYIVEPNVGEAHITNQVEDAVMEWIAKTKKKGDEFTLRELKQKGPYVVRKITRTQLEDIVNELVLDGALEAEKAAMGSIILRVL